MTEHRLGFWVSSAVAWGGGVLAVWLGFHRPFTESHDLAASLPATVGAFQLAHTSRLTEREVQLLGTADATSRTYRGPDGEDVFVMLVVHGSNWKSVHPPEYCLRGSNMVIIDDEVGDDVGTLTLFSRDRERNYVSVFRYGADGLATGAYSEFAWHHMPRAVFRAAIRGYLIRVESWAGTDDASRVAALARCRSFLRAAESALERMTSQ